MYLVLFAQSAICACKQLRSLILKPRFGSLRMFGFDNDLFQSFMASLPELRVLPIQEASQCFL